jgi:hypothetical protein
MCSTGTAYTVVFSAHPARMFSGRLLTLYYTNSMGIVLLPLMFPQPYPVASFHLRIASKVDSTPAYCMVGPRFDSCPRDPSREIHC